MTLGRLPFRHNRAVAHMNLELLEKCAQDFHKAKLAKTSVWLWEGLMKLYHSLQDYW